jgi:3-hydroxyisobutyrate dehydrogenase
MKDEAKTVGFIGLGVMGAGMAMNLIQAGFTVVVHDTRKDAAADHLAAGAAWAASPCEVAQRSDAIVSCLPSVSAIETVALGADGLIHALRAGQAYFETSTGSPTLIRRIHEAFAARGAQALDAPISGGARGARMGRLAIWVGGDKATFDRHLPVLRAMGSDVVHVGGIGAGLVTKLVNNCASQSIQAAIAESFVLGVKAGADPLGLWEAIRQSVVGRRRTFDGLIKEFLPGTYEPPTTALRIVDKDVQLAADLAREMGVPMPIADIARADIEQAMQRGWADHDRRSVMLLPQQRVGVKVAVPAQAIQEVLQRDPVAPTDVENGPAR